jgi:hypothetical protein
MSRYEQHEVLGDIVCRDCGGIGFRSCVCKVREEVYVTELRAGDQISALIDTHPTHSVVLDWDGSNLTLNDYQTHTNQTLHLVDYMEKAARYV